MGASLGRLKTDLGERSTYDAASQCSRCGYCEQSCPTYKATGDEKKSPRGRNQLVRLMLEGKLKDKAAAKEALDSCLLCSGCSTTCYAHVPTADIVLEGRRLLRDEAPWLAKVLSGLLLNHRGLFEVLLKAANYAKRAGLSRIGRPFLRLAGLPGLAEADQHVSRSTTTFSHEILGTTGPMLQFLPCGTRYLFTEVAEATQKALGGTTPMKTGCCGLLAYNYGDVEDAREFARRVIADSGEGPIAVDCSSCAAFLKQYEQLFLGAPEQEKAKAFAARIRDVVELYDQAASPASPATYHESCRACHGQGVKAAKSLDFTPMTDADNCCGGAGAFSFLHPELSDELLKKKVHNIANTRAKVVATSSTSCLIQLADGLAKYYPSCQVVHVSQIAAAKKPHGP